MESVVRIVTSLIVKFEGTTPRYLCHAAPPLFKFYYHFLLENASLVNDVLIIFISNGISSDTIDLVL